MTTKHIQTITVREASDQFDRSLFESITWSKTQPGNHTEVANSLKDKHPYTITILIDPLKWDLRNKKEYVKKTKNLEISKYRELLYDLFFREFGQLDGNELYRKWLDTYQSMDEVIIEKELEPRYKQSILNRYKNHEKLFKDCIRIDRERYYRLPEPLNWIDWRNPYDTIFVWEENGHKVARKGGNGSSGQRETNTILILGLLEINRHSPVPSYLFVYTDKNELKFLKKFDRLCVPINDIGSNYPSHSSEQVHQIMRGGWFMQWDIWNLRQVKIIQYS